MDDTTYKLKPTNYRILNHRKQQIVVGHSTSSDMRHAIGWANRLDGNYTKTAPYTIDISGNVFKHYDPDHSSDFIGIKEIDNSIIPVVLENEGWLIKDIKNNQFINWIGDIYNRGDEVVERRWRSHTYWAPYSKEQLTSLIDLVTELCNDFYIPHKTLEHNTKVHAITDYEGVVFRSNYSQYFTDLSPAWDYSEFKNKLELK